jgi:proline-specific peptidase
MWDEKEQHMMLEQTGYIPVVNDYRVWFRSVGGGAEHEAIPLLVLHGGPGCPHDYLENLSALASERRRVIFYDQLGCGNSDLPDDTSLWTVERFTDEIDVVRKALKLEQVHVLGQSCGGMLGIEYAIRQPRGLVSLILADSMPSMVLWVEEANRLRAELPPEVNATLLRHEQAGTTDSPEYRAAVEVFNRRHVCRLETKPEFVQRANAKTGFIYQYMNGPSEFHVIGVIKDWDRTDRLGDIQAPTLILSGKYDESTPLLNEILHRGIPDSQWVIFEQSAHLPHVEEEERFMRVVAAFLEQVESRTGE